jgi:hypothetical protein
MQIAPKLSSWNLTSIVVDDHTTTYPRCAACSLFLVTAARTPSSHFVSLTRGCWPLGPKPQQKQEPRPQISQRVWSWQISGAHPLAHAPCLSVSSTAVSSTAVSLHWWIAISALRTCLLRTCLTVGACRAEVKEEAATADTTIGVTDHIVHLRYTHLNCSLPYSCPKLLDERLFGVGRQKQKQQGQELR